MSHVVYELPVVKVKPEVVRLVKAMVKDGYYRSTDEEKERALNRLNEQISSLYGAKTPLILIGSQYDNVYCPATRELRLTNYSIISFLHEYRHHLQCDKGLQFKGLTIEQDARAWSLRVFSRAVPKMFLESVKKGNVIHVKYDSVLDRVVDDCRYI